MANIFINYRRADSITVAFIIYNKLTAKNHTVFIDKESIPKGFDFEKVIREKIGKSDVMLSLIDNQWLTLKDENGKCKIRTENDYVRMELAEALKSDSIRVIPVIIDDAEMPPAKSLPANIRNLPKQNAVTFLSDEFDESANRVLAEIERTLRLLKSKDLSPYIDIIDLQDTRCVAFALKTAMEANLRASKNITVQIDVDRLAADTWEVARLKKGDGAYILSALYAAEQFGVTFCEAAVKGKTKSVKKESAPASERFLKLKRFTVNSIDEMIMHLNANRPILAGVSVFKSTWYSKKASQNGILLLPQPHETSLGGHTVVITHIDLIKNRIKFANGWSKEWGDNGFGYFSEESFRKYLQGDGVFAIESVFA